MVAMHNTMDANGKSLTDGLRVRLREPDLAKMALAAT
jgi:hypothetical protein